MLKQQESNHLTNLFPLAWRILDEEIEVINKAYRTVLGEKLVYAKDKTIIIRLLSRHKRNLLVRLAEKITDKALPQIDFTENSLDQLKVRIILRKYIAKIVFKLGFIRFYFRLLCLKNMVNKLLLTN